MVKSIKSTIVAKPALAAALPAEVAMTSSQHELSCSPCPACHTPPALTRVKLSFRNLLVECLCQSYTCITHSHYSLLHSSTFPLLFRLLGLPKAPLSLLRTPSEGLLPGPLHKYDSHKPPSAFGWALVGLSDRLSNQDFQKSIKTLKIIFIFSLFSNSDEKLRQDGGQHSTRWPDLV